MVNKKLEELYRELERGSVRPTETMSKNEPDLTRTINDDELGSKVDRLEEMMLLMQGSGEADPEMQQIEGVLEKILDNQHPERVKEKIGERNGSKQVFPEEMQPEQNEIYLLSHKPSYETDPIPILPLRNGFYGLEDEITDDQEACNAIETVIHHTQELMTGSTVKMRLLSDVYVNEKLIPKDQFIYGTCKIDGERLTIDIECIRTDNSVFPVSMSAYDLDGLEGIYIR